MASGFTQDHLNALQAAFAGGELTVEYDGNKVTYRSTADIERAMARVARELSADAGKPPVRRVRCSTAKGVY